MKEVRKTQNISTPTDGESRHVEGYALVFNTISCDLGGFVETIDPTALKGVVEKSDVFCLLNHDERKGLLARSRYGKGSLTLEVDGHGLKYSFDAPRTALGDELLEGLRRGDITASSFAFQVGKDIWTKRKDGTVLRTITQIDQLFDVSPVYEPAYESTEVEVVDKRGFAEFQAEEIRKKNILSMNKNKRSKAEILEQLKALTAELEAEEAPQEEAEEAPATEEQAEEKEAPKAEEATEAGETQREEQAEEAPATEEAEAAEEEPQAGQPAAEVEEENTEVEEGNENKQNRNSTMKFKLIKAVNDIVEGKNLDEAAQKINKEGRSAMNKAGLAANGNITIPVERREDPTGGAVVANGILATVETQGKENVATDKLDILEPLRANMVLAKAGATYMTGLVGDVSIPVYSGSNVGWKGEVVTADNGEGEFSEIVLKPKRLTAFVDVSKQFLIQDSNDAEEMLKRDIINAIGEKLEQTILGVEAGTANKPEGVFNGVTADTVAVKFGDIVDMEAALEEENVNDYKYIVSPSAKAILRKTSKDNGSGQFVMVDGEIEGREVFVSSAVAKKGVLVGDFKDYVVAQWGGLDLTVDQYTKAADGMVRLVINSYFDAKPRRANAFVKRILK